MLELAKEIRTKCSILSICQSIVENDLGKLYSTDTALLKNLDNLSSENTSELFSLLIEMID